MRKTLYLIDGTALLYRSYYAFIKNPLVNSQGQHTSAVYGVINSFLHILELKQAENILISFDRKAPTFRHGISEEYKANRPPMPDDLVSQVQPVQDFFRLVGLPEISLDGYEADDVLATLGEHFKGDYDIVYVTSDKDYSQLVEERAVMFDPAKDLTLDRDAVYAKYGIHPEQFVDYLALVGDSSDNIPGVRGIGPKAAEPLLKEFGSLEEIYARLDEVPDKYRKKLAENRDNAFLSKELAQIVRDVPIELPAPDKLKFDPGQLARAGNFLAQFELQSLKRRIENRYGVPAAASRAEENQELVQGDIFSQESQETQAKPRDLEFTPLLGDRENLPRLLEELGKAENVSLDTETDSLDPTRAVLVGISLCVKEDEAWYLPLGHQMHENLPLESTLRSLRQALKGKLVLGHNLKYDLIVLHRHGWPLENPIWDTMLAAYILDPGTNQYSLDACAAAELNHMMIPISSLLDKKQKTSFDLVDVNAACEYSAEDAWAVFQLYPIYRKRLENTGLTQLFDQIEIPLIPVLQRMEENGVSLDIPMLQEISRNINLELKSLSEEIYAYAGYQFNLNSTQQLAKLLFEEKKLPAGKKTKTGYSTDTTVLEELAGDYEIADKLIQFRMLSKLESTYVSALPKLINPDTGRVHSSFNQTVASTGRLSSSNPNLQNIPIRTELGRSIRKAFIASDPAWAIMSADYSQIELRLLALMSEDEVLVEAFQKDLDIHRQTAAIITGKPLEEVSSEERRRAKVINFGLLYGMGQKKLARELGIPQDRAKEMIKHYFERFPSIGAYIANSKAEAKLNRYCQTIFGRKLYLRNINSANQGLRAEAERVAVNMPIQGSAADLIKIAMIDIHSQFTDNPSVRMVLQVHDELVFEVKREFLPEAEKIVRAAMENALPEQYRKIVTLRTDISHGKSWFEAH
ncbi:MAG: DNA polymerase I [Candidatus Syntrophosphaera sp.]|nr:DNA polymerase I [Candidatus Syntrophosphaera sp.]